MSGLRRNIKEDDVGKTFLFRQKLILGETYQKGVMTQKDKDLYFFTIEDGTELFINERSSYYKGWEIVWNTPMPDLDAERLGKIHELLSTSRYTQHAFLFTVGACDEAGNHALEMIYNESYYKKFFEETEISQKLAESVHISPNALKNPFAEGDILLIKPKAVAKQDNPIIITKADGLVTGITREEAHNFANLETEGFKFPVWEVGGPQDFEREIGHKLSKHDKDEVLVIAYDPSGSGDDRGDDTHISVLSSQGAKLYWCDCLEDDLYGTHFEHGIHIGTDVTWYDNGDDGAEWEAAFAKATIADLKRHGIGWADIEDFISDFTGNNPTIAEVAAMLAADWDYAVIRTKGDNQERQTEEEAYTWIMDLAKKYNIAEDSLIRSEETKDGFFMMIFKNGHQLASATIAYARDKVVLTRWVRLDEAQEIKQEQVRALREAS